MVLTLLLALVLAFGVCPALGVRKNAGTSRPVRARQLKDAYDYVIIGAGTAGLTVADRLSEDNRTTVIVIEQGDLSDSPLISSLQSWFQLAQSPEFFYNITSAPQVHLNNRTLPVLVGKMVGGSSAVNAMIAVRGTRDDYDRWTQFLGRKATTWGWEGMRHYFNKAVNLTPPDLSAPGNANITWDPSFWGNKSTVEAGWPSFQYPGTYAQFQAWSRMPETSWPDYMLYPAGSGSGMPGVLWHPTFMDPMNATRSYSRTGHYDNIVERENFQLITGQKVNRILFDETTAYGVAYESVGEHQTKFGSVRANKEVILAAGALHSPQILQRSGVGPKALLDLANIPVIVDLPGVGQNFQDHPMANLNITLQNWPYEPSTNELRENTTFKAWADALWAENRTGPYSVASGNAAAWLPFPWISARFEELAAALSLQDPATLLPPGTHPAVVEGYRAQLAAMAKGLRSNNTSWFNLFFNGSPTNSILVNLHALSRGTVNIDPADPSGEPVVDYRALSNPLDTRIMADLVRFVRKYYFENPAYAGHDPVELSPGANVTTDADFEAYFAQTLRPSGYHPSGTCAMMARELGGVTDVELNVYGTKRLRVVDASIMPVLVGANTCHTVYAVAEKVADMIKAGCPLWPAVPGEEFSPPVPPRQGQPGRPGRAARPDQPPFCEEP